MKTHTTTTITAALRSSLVFFSFSFFTVLQLNNQNEQNNNAKSFFPRPAPGIFWVLKFKIFFLCPDGLARVQFFTGLWIIKNKYVNLFILFFMLELWLLKTPENSH